MVRITESGMWRLGEHEVPPDFEGVLLYTRCTALLVDDRELLVEHLVISEWWSEEMSTRASSIV